MTTWEYWTAPITTIREADALGRQGWELCGFLGDVAWFRRDRTARALAEQGERIAAGEPAR